MSSKTHFSAIEKNLVFTSICFIGVPVQKKRNLKKISFFYTSGIVESWFVLKTNGYNQRFLAISEKFYHMLIIICWNSTICIFRNVTICTFYSFENVVFVALLYNFLIYFLFPINFLPTLTDYAQRCRKKNKSVETRCDLQTCIMY